jgi:DNA-binding NarL/FixJ family response regulator
VTRRYVETEATMGIDIAGPGVGRVGPSPKHLIVLFSQQPFIAKGLTEALKGRADLELTVCDTLAGVLTCLRTVQPAAVVVYLESGVGLADLHDLLVVTRAPVVLWGGEFGYEFSYQALQCGIRGILPASMPVDDLLAAVDEIMGGGLCFAKQLMENFLCHKRIALTRRERQVASLVAQGLKNKEIATTLGLTEGTVKVYVSRLFQKLGMKDRLDLALYGLRNMFSGGTGPDVRSDPARERQPEPDLLPHSFLFPSRAPSKANTGDRGNSRGPVH